MVTGRNSGKNWSSEARTLESSVVTVRGGEKRRQKNQTWTRPGHADGLRRGSTPCRASGIICGENQRKGEHALASVEDQQNHMIFVGEKMAVEWRIATTGCSAKYLLWNFGWEHASQLLACAGGSWLTP